MTEGGAQWSVFLNIAQNYYFGTKLATNQFLDDSF